MSKLFDKVKSTAKEQGISLLQLNKEAKLGTNAIYSWKDNTPNVNSLKAVADVLGVTTDYLLGFTEEKKETSETTIDLDKALKEKGVAMSFQGQELSDKAKQAVLSVLELMNDQNN